MSRGAETVGLREPRDSRSSRRSARGYMNPHCFLSRVGRKEQKEKASGCLLSFGHKFFRLFNPLKGPTEGKRHLLQRAGSSPEEAILSLCCCSVSLSPGLLASLWASWPPFPDAPPCLFCVSPSLGLTDSLPSHSTLSGLASGENYQDFCTLRLGVLERPFQFLFSQNSWKMRLESR